MRVDVITSLAGLEALQSAWEGLTEGRPSLTLQHSWFAAAAETLYPLDGLHVIVVRQDGVIVAIAPLARSGRSTSERLELLGSSDLHEPTGLLHRDDDALAALVGAIIDTRRPVHLGRLPDGESEIRHLTSLRRRQAITALRPPAGTPVVTIASTWDEYQTTLSSSRRSSLRRDARRAAAAGGTDFEVRMPTGDDVDDIVDEFMAVEHRSWKGMAGSSLASRARLGAFYRAYARRAALQRALRVSRLSIGGQVAAAQLAVEHARRLWVLKIGYDDRWSGCAPGLVLTHETLRWAFERRLDGYEFLGDEAPWTRVWTDRVHPHRVVRMYPTSARSFKGLASDAVVLARKRVSHLGGT